MVAETASSLSDEQRLAWLRLIRSDNVDPITFRDLIDRFGNASAALEALPDLARRVGRRIRICSIEHAEREVDAIDAMGARLIAIGERDYPPWFARIDSAPPVITIRGDSTILAKPMIAIVGSRNASVSGRKMAVIQRRLLVALDLLLPRGSLVASIRQLMKPRSSRAPWQCLPAASTVFIQHRTRLWPSGLSPRAASKCRKHSLDLIHAPATFRAAIGSCRAFPWV
jgi:hypothetical protein